MDSKRIVAFIQNFPIAVSRRGVLAGLTGGVLAAGIGGLGEDEAEARKRDKRQRKNKRKRKNKRRNAPEPGPEPTPEPTPAPTPEPGPLTRADATCTPPINRNINPAGGDRRIAQSFTALSSGELVSAEISANKRPESDGDFVLRLAPVDGSGFPTLNVLAEAVVPNAELPDSPAIVRFTFPNPFTVVAGTEYALVLTRLVGGGFDWQGNDSNPCAGSALFSNGPTEPFEEVAEIDLIFTIFVTS